MNQDYNQRLDNILANLAWNGKYTDSGQEVASAGAVVAAKQAITDLFLSIVGEDDIEEKYKHLVGEDAMYDVGRDDLRQQIRNAIQGEPDENMGD